MKDASSKMLAEQGITHRITVSGRPQRAFISWTLEETATYFPFKLPRQASRSFPAGCFPKIDTHVERRERPGVSRLEQEKISGAKFRGRADGFSVERRYIDVNS